MFSILPVWPFATVRSHVCRYAARLGKCSIANTAVERLFTRMCSTMCGQVCRLRKWLIAIITSVWTFSRMGPHVSFQCAGACIPMHIENINILTNNDETHYELKHNFAYVTNGTIIVKLTFCYKFYKHFWWWSQDFLRSGMNRGIDQIDRG